MLRLRYDRGTLLLEGLPPGAPLPEGFVWDDRVNLPRGDARRYHDVVMALHRSRTPYEDEARAYKGLDALKHHVRFEPRDYQAEAVEAWAEAGRRGVVVLPTGAGKSFVAELCVARCKRSALIIAPTIDLVTQWHGVLSKAFRCEVGMLGGGSHELHELTVSTYDSAYIHMERYGDRFGLVIFDEVHHLPSDHHAQIAELLIAPFRLGLSATPERPDGLHQRVDELVGPVVYEKGIKDLSGLVLADYEVIKWPVSLTPEEQEAYEEARMTYKRFVASRGIWMGGAGGWQRFLREAARSRDGRAALRAHRDSRRIMHGTEAKLDALTEILFMNEGRRTIVFTNDNATVYRISRDFGIPCITHETGAEERREILERLGSGEYSAVVTSRVLNEGVDIPAAQVGVVLSGTSTVREHVQRLGRILRPKEGKRALLYEVVTVDTVEEYSSERRNEHDAYR
ncbi:MAG: DEAD/DEAH box helicase [Alphaproteobacteria bacterium]|nr:DEAD/DEAH box helicase [Alphaproteobacteria bacterium]